MKYILGISLIFKHYKGATKIKIFSDDILIDDITLDRTISCESDFSYYLCMDDVENFTCKASKMSAELPAKLFYYEIDDSIIGKKISFEIDDQNSNYTNGFMTKSNLYMLNQLFLMPKESLKTRNLPKLGKFIRKRWRKYDVLVNSGKTKLKADTIDWPFFNKFYMNGDSNLMPQDVWIGGTNTIYAYVRKKFGVKHLWSGKKSSGAAVVSGLPVWLATYCHKYGLINRVNEDK